jgi:hypothetical protein
MRVIELWTNTPMRFGKGGNVMTTHLREVPANEERTPQTWHQAPGRLPEQCLSLSMTAHEVGVVVRIEHEGGSSSTLIRDFASALLAEGFTIAPHHGVRGEQREMPSTDAPPAQPQQKGKRR